MNQSKSDKFIRSIKEGVHRTMWVAHTDFTEMTFGWMTLIWGSWALLNADTLADTIYLSSLMPAWVVGLAFTSVGVAQVVSTARFHYLARRVTTLLMMFVWAAAAGAAFVENPTCIEVPFYAHLAAVSLWLHIRVRFRGRSL